MRERERAVEAVQAQLARQEAEQAARLEELDYQMEAQRSAREAAEKLAATRGDALAQAQARIEALEGQLAETGKARDAAQAALEAKTAELEQALNRAARARADLGERLRAAEAASAEQAARLEELDYQMEAQRSAREAAEKLAATRGDALAHAQARIEALEGQLAALERRAAAEAEARGLLPAALRPVLAGSPAARVSGERVIIPADLLFNRGGTRLSEAGRVRVREMAEALKALPADRPWTILVTGHADQQPPRRGSAFDNNREVALARAFNLTQALIEAGVPSGRLMVAGMGDERPLVAGNDPVAQALNRRVELELVPGR